MGTSRRVRSPHLVAALLAIVCPTCVSPDPATEGEHAGDGEAEAVADRWIHEAELAKILAPFLSEEGFLDPAFAEHVAHPSAHLSDFFGLQAIRDVSRETLMADFVPTDADVVREDEHSVTLAFREGYQATFYPQSALRAAGQTVPVSHAAFEGDSWRIITEDIRRFQVHLDQRGLIDRYLPPNPSFSDELAAQRIRSQGVRAATTVDPSLAVWRGDPSAVLLLPERVHGAQEDIEALRAILREGDADWLGLEMLYAHQQPLLDGFNSATEGSPAYLEARDSLEAYFTEWWNGRAGPRTSGAENLYFRVVMEAHRRGVAIHALEASTMEYVFFRYGEAPFGGSVRSYQWATHVPDRGRGIVFGGSAHFVSSEAGAVQDYLRAMSPNRLLVSRRDLGG